MPTLSFSTTWATGSALTEAQLDVIKSTWETFLNSTKLDGNNIQAGGIGSLSLASNAVTTAKLASNAVTSAKLLDGAVTRSKLAALGHQISSSSSTFTTTGTSYVDITNLTVTITTGGRPVFIGLIGADGTNDSEVFFSESLDPGGPYGGNIKIIRDSTDIGLINLSIAPCNSGNGNKYAIPPTSLFHYDAVAAGTYTYKLQVNTLHATVITAGFSHVKLIAWELQ